MRFIHFAGAALTAAALLVSCARGASGGRVIARAEDGGGVEAVGAGVEVAVNGTADGYRLERALEAGGIPQTMRERIREAGLPIFLPELQAAMTGDPFLWRLVDKRHALPGGYEPDDLVPLDNSGSYRVSRSDLRLRRAAADALERMARAASSEGITLTASSAYRSFDYQREVYNRNVRESGQETADRESSRPGFSQHQLGLVVDFGSITDAFAGTAAGRWLLANGPEFGWSLSFPDGYEQLTGYRWESWHYRYMGPVLTAFTSRWFSGIQQYALQFIHEWEAAAP
jgi:D-alanyl-D-alanine carboxypeptidase